MKFRILGHACLEVEADGVRLLCDPWLAGSAYWRSWWNFPPVPDGLLDSLTPDFIYLSHLHWDHFHGPTLRRLGLDRTILVPKTPDRRMIGDLRKMGCRNIRELDHGTPVELAPGLRITSYQIGPFADSGLIIESGGTTLFNANDAKIMGAPLRRIMHRHPKIDFILRSHSSANSRLCFQFSDAPEAMFDDPTAYSRDFARVCRAVQPRYAIPFASNHCFLHDETFAFNDTVNFSGNVATYFREHGIDTPECVPMAPGDSWDSDTGFSLVPAIDDIPTAIGAYRHQKAGTLHKQQQKEDRTGLAVGSVIKHLQHIAGDTPWIMRRLFRNKPILLVGHSAKGDKAVAVDLARRSVREVPVSDAAGWPIQIHASALIFNDCCRTRNWNSLGISKRVRFLCRRKDASILRLFNYVLNAHEYEIFPVSKILNPRFLGVWLRRWRELFLYAHVATNFLLRRGFDMSRHLPRAPR
jgi:UDP-MurNAc hydroxylase